MTEIIVFIVHVIREILEERDKRAKAEPVRQAFSQDPPYAPPRPDRPKGLQQPATPSMDPPYERSTWRTIVTLLTLILMGALVLLWILQVQN